MKTIPTGGTGAGSARTRSWPALLAAILLVTAFFEGGSYSFQWFGMRIRSVQVLEVLFLGVLAVLFLLGKWRWRRSPLDPWLLAYLAINFAALFNSRWPARSLKIFLLLVSLVALYWLVYQLLRTFRDVMLAFRVFLALGLLQVVFGIYQVLAGAVNHYRGWRLPIGPLGLVHREFINSVWGRPYGTQVEPDFYGAICMAFALIFIVLLFSRSATARPWQWAGAVLSLAGLYLSFVRTAWLVFLLFLLLLFLVRIRRPAFQANGMLVAIVVGAFIGFHVFALHAIAPLKAIHESRFSNRISPAPHQLSNRTSPAPHQSSNRTSPTPRQPQPVTDSHFGGQNVRFVFIKISWQAFRQCPLLGHGPGSFAYQLWTHRLGEAGAQKKIAAGAFPQTQPSLLFSVLGDTGIVGLACLAVIAWLLLALNLKAGAGFAAMGAPQAMALGCGFFALMASYVLTSGFWLPLTWVFLGLHVASLERPPGKRTDAAGAGRGTVPCA